MPMSKASLNKIGIVALKIGLTVVVFVIAAGLGSRLSKAITGLNYAATSMPYIFLTCMIIPIWYGAPIWWRIAAASGGIAAGVSTWLISLFVGSSDIAMSSQMIGGIRSGAIIVSLVVCVLILRAGRLRNKR